MPRTIRDRRTYASEWRSPWKPDGLRKNVTLTRWPLWVRQLRQVSGIYFIRDRATKQLLYLGRARRDLGKVLQRHFWHYSDSTRERHRYASFDRAAVEVKIYLVPVAWVVATEADLLELHKPPENTRLETSSRTIVRDRTPGEDDDDDGFDRFEGAAAPTTAPDEAVPF